MDGRAVILNPHTGEAVLRDGSGNETRIVYTEEAIIAIEQALDVGALELVHKVAVGRVKLLELQVLVWAGINAHRSRSGSGKPVSPDKAMRVITACGGMTQIMPTIADALVACTALGIAGDEDEDDAEADEVDPTNGDGDGSVPPSPQA